MDRNAFDALMREFGSRRSRRSALLGLASGLFGLGAGKGAAAQVGVAALTCGQFYQTSGDCNAGLRCGAASDQCFAIASSRTRCNSNRDCPRNYETCNSNGRCINTVVGDCAQCERSGDCNERCRRGRCVVV